MDGVAGALILMVVTGLYMAFELQAKRLLGAIVLLAGLLSGTFFCVGLRWFY
jgi:hypothetical protein